MTEDVEEPTPLEPVYWNADLHDQVTLHEGSMALKQDGREEVPMTGSVNYDFRGWTSGWARTDLSISRAE